MKIKPALIKAYQKTTYKVFNSDISIRLDRGHPKLDELLQNHNKSEWIFLTAWNPSSGRLTHRENELRNSQLEKDLSDFIYFEGKGIPDNGKWEAEASYLVLGCSKTEALLLANKYRQNAIVYGKLEESAKLIFPM